jgi:hypothetical protein
MLQQIESMNIAPGREAEVAARVRDFVAMLQEHGKRSHLSDEMITREIDKLSTAIWFGGYGAASVVPVDEVTRHFPALTRSGYSGGEIDIIRAMCQGGKKIEPGFDADHIVVAGRRFSRFELREAGRPQSWTNRESWHGQFPPLKG